MEFSNEDLNRILMDLFNSASTTKDVHSDNNSSIPSTVKEEASSSNEQQGPAPIVTNNTIDRQYIFIIFNNPRWSQSLQRRRTHVRTGPASSSQLEPQQSNHGPSNHTQQSESALDHVFTTGLRQLIEKYMAHTERPIPLRTFLDFTPTPTLPPPPPPPPPSPSSPPH